MIPFKRQHSVLCNFSRVYLSEHASPMRRKRIREEAYAFGRVWCCQLDLLSDRLNEACEGSLVLVPHAERGRPRIFDFTRVLCMEYRDSNRLCRGSMSSENLE